MTEHQPALSLRPQPTVAPPPIPTEMQQGDACSFVILGGAGDLAKRKLIPAYYELERKKLLAPGGIVVGAGVEKLDDEAYRKIARESLGSSEELQGVDEEVWSKLKDRIFFVSGDLTTDEIYATLLARLPELEKAHGRKDENRLFYLAVPPSIFTPIVGHLSRSGLVPKAHDAKERPWRRVILEKPFGRSLATAHALNELVLEAFNEHQIYRIDHYLGKETVQNILVLRSANAIFEAVWSRAHIASVQITAAETVGVEQRAGYYEQAGVVRDMFQNHLLQLLALTAMEPPNGTEPDAIRDEKVKVLRSVVPFDGRVIESTVLGQYSAGEVKGEPVAGYHDEPGISAKSNMPTYGAVKVLVDTDRWRGVPFFLRSGKRMHKRVSEIAIELKHPKRLMFEKVASETIEPNMLVCGVQPDDGVSLRFEVKVPGAAMALTPGIEVLPVNMEFDYASAFGADIHPAYETLLLDCMIGDATLFTRSDEVDAGWRVTEPILDFWEAPDAPRVERYTAGSWGPAASDAMLKRDKFRWREP